MYRIKAHKRGIFMSIAAADVIPLTQARAKLSDLADQVKAGAEKIITKNGESYVALIDAERLDYYHRLERERIHLLVLDEVERGLADVADGRTRDAREALTALQRAANKRGSKSRPTSR
jgi:prevent-host-death family protein